MGTTMQITSLEEWCDLLCGAPEEDDDDDAEVDSDIDNTVYSD